MSKQRKWGEAIGKMKKAQRGKYTDWLTEEGLLKLEGWARDGLTDEQIAHNVGVSRSTLSEWKNKYQDISDALKRGKEVIDIMVENSLLKRALGYEYIERKYVQVTMDDEEYFFLQNQVRNEYKLNNPEATLEEIEAAARSVSRMKRVLAEEKTKEVVPDVTAQIFWLKNRKPETWRDRQQTEITGKDGEALQVVFGIPRPPKQEE